VLICNKEFADLDHCLISANVLHSASLGGNSLVCSDQAGDELHFRGLLVKPSACSIRITSRNRVGELTMQNGVR